MVVIPKVDGNENVPPITMEKKTEKAKKGTSVRLDVIIKEIKGQIKNLIRNFVIKEIEIL